MCTNFTLTRTIWLAPVHAGDIRLLGWEGKGQIRMPWVFAKNVAMWSLESMGNQFHIEFPGLGLIQIIGNWLLMIYKILLASPIFTFPASPSATSPLTTELPHLCVWAPAAPSVRMVPLPMLCWQNPTFPLAFSSVTWLGQLPAPKQGWIHGLASCATAQGLSLEQHCAWLSVLLVLSLKGALHFPFALGPTDCEPGPAHTPRGWVRCLPLCSLTEPWLLLHGRTIIVLSCLPPSSCLVAPK